MTQPTSSSRSTNISIRVTPEQRDLIDQAALLNNKTRADFILEAATRAAQDSVLDQVLFPVPVEQFEAFQRLLESSSEQDKRLSALMARTSRWGK